LRGVTVLKTCSGTGFACGGMINACLKMNGGQSKKRLCGKVQVKKKTLFDKV